MMSHCFRYGTLATSTWAREARTDRSPTRQPRAEAPGVVYSRAVLHLCGDLFELRPNWSRKDQVVKAVSGPNALRQVIDPPSCFVARGVPKVLRGEDLLAEIGRAHV